MEQRRVRMWIRLSAMGLALWAAGLSTFANATAPRNTRAGAVRYGSREKPLQLVVFAGEPARPDDSPRATEARAKLNEILNRAEFREGTGPSAMDLWRARVNRWIIEHIVALLRRLHISEKTGNYFAWGVIFLALVVLFYAVYRWLAKAAGKVEFVAETEPVASDVRQWLAEAMSAADRGNYREAIHCAYWAAVARLEDMRLLTRDRARTPRESLRLMEQHPREKGFLQTVTSSFELIWYGYRPASQADWAQTKEQLERMGCLQGSIAPTAPS
jgi:Domain of unknown function (DUF4129)